MTKRNFPHIRLTSQSIRGNYYAAYENNDENAKQGYTIFISTTKGVHNSCECMGYVHGNECYHMKAALDLEEMFFSDTNMEKINA